MKFLKYFYFLFLIVCVGFASGMKNNEQTFEQSIEKFVKKAMNTHHVPACSVAVIKDGKVSYVQGFGYRDVENKKPVTPETIFAIGSCTKAFTATALGVLVDQGKLDWDAPITKYLPDFEMYDKEATEKLSLRDCLCHRSGLPRYDCLWFCNNRFKNRKELVANLRHLKPSAKFREKYQYNNLMFVLAGHVLETISGISWDAFVRENITKPLSMDKTCFSPSVVPTHPNAALAYEFDKATQDFKRVDYVNLDLIGPAGSIHSCALDMAQWVIMNLQDKKINPEIHKPQMLMDQSGESNYCFGWCKGSTGEIDHGGGITGCSALVSFVPKEQFGIVVLANIENVNECFNELLAKYIHALICNDQTKIQECENTLFKKVDIKKMLSETPQVKSSILEKYVGSYKVSDDFIITITKESDKLFAQATGQEKFQLFPESETKFFCTVVDAQVSFVENNLGQVTKLILHQSGNDTPGEKLCFIEKQSFQKISPKQAQQFAGTYHNDIFGDCVIGAKESVVTCTYRPISEKPFDLGYIDGNTLKGINNEERVFRFKNNKFGIPERFDLDIEVGCPYEFVKN